MKKILLLIFIGFKFCFLSQTTVKDAGGNIYPVVKIGNQIWMAENLRTEVFANGEPITQITSNRYWQEVSLFAIDDSTLSEIWPVMCYMNNSKSKNGALYNWYVVTDERGVCPSGWHVPSNDEFVELTNYLGGMEAASKKMKSTINWTTNGTNLSKFNALPIGVRVGSGEFDPARTMFWTDDLFEETNNDNNFISFSGGKIELLNNDKESGYGTVFLNVGASVRCIKN
ncbi:MAG: fibrobacter succinogenes major paralogous domain-containing protein [Crocinitomicaceae bacterium]|nr:fibrobacter succinogenes major paralogous domain-containing protein [Crocinitomicaceae bacterium]